MKVLVGLFNAEANENIPVKCGLEGFDIAFGDQLIDKLYIREVFEKENIEMVPSIYANSGACGIIEKEAFLTIEKVILSTIKKNLSDLDGIYLHLHGASYVEEIGSGDHHIIQEVRKLVGPYLPIAVSCDPHGNLIKEYSEAIQILRSFRESPHTDNIITYQKVAGLLCHLVKNCKHIHSVYRKLPLILGGEQSVSADEPVLSINKYMDELEKNPRIMSASWHVGYLRHDCPEAGCSIVVVPASESDQEYAEEIAEKLVKYVWDRRHEFHYTGLTAEPKEALKMALEFDSKPVVITDSGDNMTSGATGWNTYILRQILGTNDLKKTILFAPIVDTDTYNQIAAIKVNETIEINLGTGHDELSKKVNLIVKLLHKSKICKFSHGQFEREMCECVVVNTVGTGIDIIIANSSYSIINKYQLEYLNIDWCSYDVTVVKQGYIFPDFKEKAQFYVMSLTDGATPQDTKNIKFKRIMRPMYPIDEI